MSILNFVDQDQLDELNEDPRIAFMELVNLAQRSLHDQTKFLDEDERSDWIKIEDLRLSFMNVVLASAKRFEVEPFVSMEVPHRKQFDMRDYDQFKFDLDHYVTQLVLDNSLRSKADTVAILPKTKDTIRGYINGLRECIEKGNMDQKKRDALLHRLDALEAELEKRRVSMVAVARIAYHLWAVPGSMWASYDVANKLLSSMMHNVAEAKEQESTQKQLPPSEPPKVLSPPRQPAPNLFAGASFADDSDEVPF
ncbi:hypothetical protein Sphch_2406 [Sphingobium chlorophenolicum L-1]|uniref:Uncharacterized protein n=1 Tax=Sphingobium chlorophenolicum L-1 TaxID=690566 RepID=F6EYB4_SPHCR|nr:hypothetical protein [Sphingobium chlorophenolicum]AEG50067.1 hypothetical protein Sphch_2406 [Sphingobium chlorophenolicum L-1]